MYSLGTGIEGNYLEMNDISDFSPVHELCGRVVHGKGIGSKVGMPTANLEVLPDMKLPDEGVYGAKVYVRDKEYIGVTNVGLRPTVDNEDVVTVETYIMDFQGDIYEENIRLELYQLLRKQQKFDNMLSLLKQLEKDCAKTREIFNF